MKYRRLSLLFAVCAFSVQLLALPQAPATQTPTSAGATEVAQAIQSARASKAGGRTDEAIKTLAALTKKYPSNTEAAQASIGLSLELDRIDEALKAYDVYATALKRQDPVVLAPVARADLRRTIRSKAGQPQLVALAQERLARAGDAEALQALRLASSSRQSVSPDDLAPTISLARLKDPAGEVKLGQLLNVPAPLEKSQVIKAIGDADARSLIPRVVGLLGDPDLNVKASAAKTLGVLQAKEAIPQLRAAFDNGNGMSKLYAAVALKRLGQTSADTFLEGLLNGQIAEIQVIAAEAYSNSTTKTPQWDKAVRTLMKSTNELHRLRAAELLACCDRPAARNVLLSALASENPLLRQEAARALDARPELADAVIARRILGDSMEAIRVYGSGMTLALARGSAASPARGRGGRP